MLTFHGFLFQDASPSTFHGFHEAGEDLAALALAAFSFVATPRRVWIALAGLAIFISGLIGGYHAGVEYDWWEGITSCSSLVASTGDPLDAIMNAPLIRCDAAPWDLFGISLAGWNFLISCGTGIAVWVLLKRGSEAG